MLRTEVALSACTGLGVGSDPGHAAGLDGQTLTRKVTPKVKRRKAQDGAPNKKPRGDQCHIARMFEGGKRRMKAILGQPHSYRMSHAEYMRYQDLILTTMLGSGSEAKCHELDYVPFARMMRLSWSGSVGSCWRRLSHLQATNHGVWPVIKEQDGRCMLVWMHHGNEATEWAELTLGALSGDVIPVRVPPKVHQLAAQEATRLGVEPSPGHLRPEGAAPDGHTWSYLWGKWVRDGCNAPA